MARRGGLHGRGAAVDAGQGLEGRVHLAELDAAAAELHLVVGAADEQQALRLEDHEVTGAVGTLPAEGGHGGVLLGVLGRVEVAGQADAADDQLARLALGHGQRGLRVDDGQVPAVQGQADADRAETRERGRARDDGGLRGAVGVPDLAAVLRQARGELGRAGLAAEDQQPDVVHGLGGPHRGEGRHGGHGGDAPLGEPRAEVHAGAHERAGGRDQARTVTPGEPHLLARGVERDGQSRQHAVARGERIVRQEDPRLGVHEGRGRAVAHRHALGGARRARGEDDPRVVLEPGGAGLRGRVRGVLGVRGVDPLVGEDAGHLRLAEHEAGALLRIVRVHGDVGRAGGEHAEDRDVQRGRARGDPHADPVSRPHAGGPQVAGGLVDALPQLRVRQRLDAVVQGGRVRVLARRGVEELHERPGGRGALGAGQLRPMRRARGVDGDGGRGGRGGRKGHRGLRGCERQTEGRTRTRPQRDILCPARGRAGRLEGTGRVRLRTG